MVILVLALIRNEKWNSFFFFFAVLNCPRAQAQIVV